AADQDLHGGIGREREGAIRAALVGLEVFKDLFVSWQLGEVGRQRDQQAFDRRPCDSDEVFIGNAFRTHELGLQALLASLAKEKAQFGVVSAKIDQIRVERLEL